MQEDQPLIKLFSKSDFEQKLFYKRQVKELQIEKGKLESYVQELEHELNHIKGKYKPEISKLQESLKERKIKNSKLKDRVKELEAENHDLLNRIL